MIPGKAYKAEDFMWMGWRRKWLILVSFLLVGSGTLTWSLQLPNSYRSETVILVVPQRVPESYVRSTVTSLIEDRLQSISPEILSRTRLERIIEDLNLYIEQRKTLTMEELVELMRENISVETIKGDAFRVSYVSGDPQNAMEVTGRLATMFIEENLHDRETLADATNQFLESQLNDARARLIEQEKKLEEYRRNHAGELPSQVDSNLQIIQNSQMQVQTLGESISRDRDRLTMLEGLVGDALALGAAPTTNPSTAASSADSLLAFTGSAIERLEAARTKLASLELRLTAAHPDITRLKRAISDFERAVENETRQRLQSDPESQSPLTAAAMVARARLREMQSEVTTLRQRISHQEGEQLRLRGVIAMYERHISAAPTRESELAELTRDYETLRSVYGSLLGRREDAKIAANLERRQVGEQFKILDPPRLPEKPFSPNRLLLNMVGAVLGLALGVGLVALLEYRDTSFRIPADVVTMLALPVLGLIPRMVTEAEQRKQRRRKRMLFTVTVSGLLLAGAATVAAWGAGIFQSIN